MTEMEKAAYIATLRGATRVTTEEIKERRTKGTPFFVIKYKDALYMTEDISLIHPYITSHYHLCSDCKRCRALPTEVGGCNKIWNIENCHIYRYNFIRLGVEAFCSGDSSKDFFAVTFCKNYVREPERSNCGIVYKDPKEIRPTIVAYRPKKPKAIQQTPTSNHTNNTSTLPDATKVPLSVAWPIGV